MKTEYLFLMTACLGLVTIVFRIFTIDRIIVIEQELYEFEKKKNRLQLENQILENQIEYYSSLYYIQQKAIDLGYVKVTSIIIIN